MPRMPSRRNTIILRLLTSNLRVRIPHSNTPPRVLSLRSSILPAPSRHSSSLCVPSPRRISFPAASRHSQHPPRLETAEQHPPRPQSTQGQRPRPQSTQQQPSRPQPPQDQLPRRQSTQQHPPRPESAQQHPPRPQSPQDQRPRPQSTQQQEPPRPQPPQAQSSRHESGQHHPPRPQSPQNQRPRPPIGATSAPPPPQEQPPRHESAQYPARTPSARSSRPLPRAPGHSPEPIDIRRGPTRPPSPALSHRSVALPPDGIPTMGADSVISLPPPHELSRPVSVVADSEYTPGTNRAGGRRRTMSGVSAISTTFSQFDILSPPRAAEVPMSRSDQVAREWRVANADPPERRQGTTEESHSSENFSTRSSVPYSQASRRTGPRRPREIVMPMPLPRLWTRMVA
ncbi:hypothetical protein B0H14DRAFT_1635438 [Mycena olivaceomarginata]|nr:hypothetical protein B0H14DRAFT_1635438 [Mycena olivaceomarginata]